jgi:hypothetical protein
MKRGMLGPRKSSIAEIGKLSCGLMQGSWRPYLTEPRFVPGHEPTKLNLSIIPLCHRNASRKHPEANETRRRWQGKTDHQGEDASHLSMDFDEFRLFRVARVRNAMAVATYIATSPSIEICLPVDGLQGS